MNAAAASEEQALLAVLTALEAAEDSGLPLAALPARLAAGDAADQAGDATTETLTRLFQEVLGLVPFALPPIIPSPKVKRRLLAAITQTEEPALPVAAAALAAPAQRLAGAPASPVAAAPSIPSLAAGSSPAAGPSFAAGPSSSAAAPSLAAAAVRARRWSVPRTPLAMAAGLMVALIGACVWLYHGMQEQGAVIARLQAEREQARLHIDQMEERMSRLTSEVGNLRSNFSVVTSPAVEVCSMRPMAPGMGDVHGIMFVAADHQHWYMSLRGLPPAGDGKVYQLWFIADRGPVSGGTFSAAAGAAWDIGAEHMPVGTREVRVTLENGAGGTAPAGPEMLRNTDPFRTL